MDENRNISTLKKSSKNMEIQCSLHISSAMVFADLAGDIDVNHFTGFKTGTFLLWFLNISQTWQEQYITGKCYQTHQVIYHSQENLKTRTGNL